MRMIKRMRVIPVDEERYILVNGMNGLLDLIDEAVYQLYLQWKDVESIIPTTDEMEMFSNFCARGYIMKVEEEKARMEEIFTLFEERFQ